MAAYRYRREVLSGSQLIQRHSALEFAGAAGPAGGYSNTRHPAISVAAMFAFAAVLSSASHVHIVLSG